MSDTPIYNAHRQTAAEDFSPPMSIEGDRPKLRVTAYWDGAGGLTNMDVELDTTVELGDITGIVSSLGGLPTRPGMSGAEHNPASFLAS